MAATTLSSMIMPQRAAICTAGFAARATHCARPGGVRSVSLVRSSIFHTTGRGTVTVPRAVADPGKEGSATLPMELTGATSAVVSDEAVPEGHKGLHDFLYGESGAEGEHGTAADGEKSVYEIREGEDDGESIVPAASWVEARELEKPTGVYAVYDASKELQFVGYSRNVVTAVRGAITRAGADRCAYVRVMVFANKSMATRANLTAEAQRWISEAGFVPPGNDADRDRDLFEASSGGGGGATSSAAMSEAEREEYEQKKLKLRKAMGHNLADDVEGETLTEKDRRLQMLKAVEGDDWSEVIDGQTKATVTSTEEKEEGVVSPFAGGASSAGTEIDLEGLAFVETLELNAENVDKVLDEVRPYLVADGGNVEVAGVENGIVALKLVGACGTCPSSTSTMKMGIEKALFKHFGEDNIKEVVQLDAGSGDALVMSAEAIDEHLEILRPAITGYGGSVTVLEVEGGVCTLEFSGPQALAMSIAAAIRDKFPLLKECKIKQLD